MGKCVGDVMCKRRINKLKEKKMEIQTPKSWIGVKTDNMCKQHLIIIGLILILLH